MVQYCEVGYDLIIQAHDSHLLNHLRYPAFCRRSQYENVCVSMYQSPRVSAHHKRKGKLLVTAGYETWNWELILVD